MPSYGSWDLHGLMFSHNIRKPSLKNCVDWQYSFKKGDYDLTTVKSMKMSLKIHETKIVLIDSPSRGKLTTWQQQNQWKCHWKIHETKIVWTDSLSRVELTIWQQQNQWKCHWKIDKTKIVWTDSLSRRELTIWQQRNQWKLQWKIDFVSF